MAKIAVPVAVGSEMDTPEPTAAQALTAEGTILGTLQYMSPEQLEGNKTDTRSDIFAFGAMLYEMITGRKVFQGSNHASLIAAVMSADPPPVSTTHPMASPALDRLVRKCLAKSPDDRWQSAGDLLSELEWITETSSKAGIPAPVAARRRNRERLAWLMAGLAVVLPLVSLVTVAHMWEGPARTVAVRFQIPLPDKLNFYWYDLPAVSPDGERIAVVVTGYFCVFLRSDSWVAWRARIAVKAERSEFIWSLDGGRGQPYRIRPGEGKHRRSSYCELRLPSVSAATLPSAL